MKQKELEKKSLIISALMNFIIAIAGIWVFSITNIQALFLDCVFSVIGFTSSLLAITISKKSKKKTKSYPEGLYFLEPLYAILKSFLVLILLAISTAETSGSAYDYFFHGIGQPMNISPVLPYTLCMVILCFGLSFFNNLQNKKMNHVSTILTVESRSNFIDGLQSLGIGIAIALLYFIKVDSPLGFLHYTGDFFITVVLVAVSLKGPVLIIINSFKELSNGVTQNKEICETIQAIMNTHMNHISPNIKYSIFKTGMHIKVKVSLTDDLCQLDYYLYLQARKRILEELKAHYESVALEFTF